MKYEYYSMTVRADWATADKKKLIGSETQTFPGYVDLADLGTKIDGACKTLDDAGYEVVSIMPTVRGYQSQLDFLTTTPAGSLTAHDRHHAPFGYSVTDGAVITGKRERLV